MESMRQSRLERDDEKLDPEYIRKARVSRSEPDHPDVPLPSSPPMDESQSEASQNEIKPQQSIDFGELEYNWEQDTEVSMDDVGGMHKLKEELQRDIIKPLTSKREQAEALNIPLPNVIFYGPPGTGKTYIAKALASELDLPFAELSGSDVQSKWINESATKIKTLFEEARTIADRKGGAVVFLDELDAVLKQRGMGQSHEEDNKVVAEFLNHLQDTSEHNILFIGATNRIETLDEAGIRAGRIGKKIHIGKPDQDTREAIIRARLGDRPHALSDDHVEALAEHTGGLVAAELESILVDAARVAAFQRDDDEITWQDVQQAVRDNS
jgi:SpoVK/Ycf46/Vps4 family AAA+-type ATPase